MPGGWIILLVLCAVVILMGFLILRYETSRRNYDERQLYYQGRAWRLAAWVMMGWGLLCFFMEILLERELFSAGTAAVIGVVLGVFVFAEYSVVKDAFFHVRWGARPGVTVGMLAAVGLGEILNGVRGALSPHHIGLMEDGRLTLLWLYFVSGAVFLAVAATIGVKLFLRRREERE